MKLPACLMRRFPTMPLNIGHKFEDCKFVWERKISSKEKECILEQGANDDHFSSDGKSTWYKLSEKIAYIPTDHDVAHNIRVTCLPKNGQPLRNISRAPVEVGPLECPFDKRHEYKKPESSNLRFMSYNILADLYADSNYSRTVLFKHCPPHALSLDYRRQLLLKEIPGYDATIICLQEVDQKEFIRSLEPYLKFVGDYKGLYAKKGGQVAEGLATFFHQDEFELIEHQKTLLESFISDQPTNPDEDHPILNALDTSELDKCLQRLDSIRTFIRSNEKIEQRFIGRNTVLQTTLLRSKSNSKYFLLVANTHLYFAPDADHIRLLQGSVCLKYLEHLKDYYTRSLLMTSEAKISVIFCGDMNSLPKNGFHKLMTEGKVEANHPDWPKDEADAAVGLEITSDLVFSSAYQDVAYTHYVPDFNGCIDYIYYEKAAFHCDSVVPLSDHKDVVATGGLPSFVFPSDHMALVADMSFSN